MKSSRRDDRPGIRPALILVNSVHRGRGSRTAESPRREPRPSPTGASLSGRRRPDDAPISATSSYDWGLMCTNFPQLIAARARSSRSRVAACSSNAARSAAPSNACVGKTKAVGQRVIPLVRMNSATATLSSSDIVHSPSAAPRQTRCLRSNRPLANGRTVSRPCDWLLNPPPSEVLASRRQ